MIVYNPHTTPEDSAKVSRAEHQDSETARNLDARAPPSSSKPLAGAKCASNSKPDPKIFEKLPLVVEDEKESKNPFSACSTPEGGSAIASRKVASQKRASHADHVRSTNAAIARVKQLVTEFNNTAIDLNARSDALDQQWEQFEENCLTLPEAERTLLSPALVAKSLLTLL